MSNMDNLYDIFLNKLIAANDEAKTNEEHHYLCMKLHAWKEGVMDALGASFNGDYYYIEKIDSGEMKERPMCRGEFLDWKSSLGAE